MARANSRHIRLSYLSLHCMCRPRLQVEGAETHSPVVHQLQNSTTASNGVIQLKQQQQQQRNKNRSQLSQEPKHLQLRFCTRRSKLKASTKQGFKGESTKQTAAVQKKALAPLGWDSSVWEGPGLSRVQNKQYSLHKLRPGLAFV